MNATIAIGQGVGLAVACGLVALLPLGIGALAALVGLLPGALGAYDDTPVVATSVVAGLATAAGGIAIPPRIRPLAAAIGGGGVFELAAGDRLPWAPIALGAALGALGSWSVTRMLEGALTGGGTASGVAAIAAGLAVVVAGLALIPFVGYLLVPAAAWFGWRSRKVADRKYAGLRVLR
jgi:hypothetical protein